MVTWLTRCTLCTSRTNQHHFSVLQTWQQLLGKAATCPQVTTREGAKEDLPESLQEQQQRMEGERGKQDNLQSNHDPKTVSRNQLQFAAGNQRDNEISVPTQMLSTPTRKTRAASSA